MCRRFGLLQLRRRGPEIERIASGAFHGEILGKQDSSRTSSISQPASGRLK